MFAGEIEEVRGIATTDIEVDARGFHVALGDTVTISGGESDGYTGLWPLVFAGGGAAVFVDDPDAPRIDLLDGELSTIAEGSGTGVSIGGIVIEGPVGHASIPVTPPACATPPAG